MSRHGAPYPIALSGCAIVVATTEWRTDEDIVTLTVIVGSGFILGMLRPRLFAISGILIGLIVPLVALITLLTGLRTAYETSIQATSHNLTYVLGLLMLIVPATAGTLVGRLSKTAFVSRGS